MGHVGLPLGSHPAHPVYFLMEGRLFADDGNPAPEPPPLMGNRLRPWGCPLF